MTRLVIQMGYKTECGKNAGEKVGRWSLVTRIGIPRGERRVKEKAKRKRAPSLESCDLGGAEGYSGAFGRARGRETDDHGVLPSPAVRGKKSLKGDQGRVKLLCQTALLKRSKRFPKGDLT